MSRRALNTTKLVIASITFAPKPALQMVWFFQIHRLIRRGDEEGGNSETANDRQMDIQAWRPYRKKDIDMLERVQRRATKMIQKLRNISYEMRLKECGRTTLETRRLRVDQIEVFLNIEWV